MKQQSRDSACATRPGRSFSARWLLVGSALAAILFLPISGMAHYIMLKRDDDPAKWQEHLELTHPRTITMFADETATIIVEDAGTCAAWVWATVIGDPLVTLNPSGEEAKQLGILVEIEVVAGSEIGTAEIVIEWEGEHVGGEGDCQEIVAVPVTIDIITKPTEATVANIEHNAPAGDPVDMQTGEFHFHEEPDLDLGGPLPLYFQRYYSSKMRQAHVVGDLGDNWRHNFEWRAHWNGNNLLLVTGIGKVLRYLKENDVWTLLTPTENRYQIVQLNGAITVGNARESRIYKFNPQGRLIEIADGRGNRQILTYSNGRLAEVRDYPSPHMDQQSRELVFEYESVTGKLTTVSEHYWGTPGREVGFYYTGPNLTEVRDRGGNFTQYIYDTEHADPGLLTSASSPGNRTAWFQSYNMLGKVDQQWDAYGNTFAFLYDPPLNPTTTTITDPDGRETVYHFDENGSRALIGVTDPLGRRIDIGVNDQRLRDQMVSRGGALSERDYHSETGAVVRSVDENGHEIRMTYTPRAVSEIIFQDLTRIEYADGTFATFIYNSSGHMTSRTDRAGHVWTFTYNTLGQVLTATNPHGSVTKFAYNEYRNPSIIEDAAGNITAFYYDALQRVDFMALGDFITTRQFSYDAYDRLLSVRDERGNTFTRAYDLDGRLIRTTDAEGNVTEFEYDDLNQLVKVIQPTGDPVSLTYEKFGRISTIVLPGGNVITYTYDQVGRLVLVNDSLGAIGEQASNEDGWITGSQNALAAATALTRDPAGRLTGVLSPEGRAVAIGYDSMNRVVSNSLGGLTSRIGRDARGLISDYLMPGGFVSAQYAHDALGNLTAVTDPLGNDWLRTYDGLGRLASMIDPLGNATSYTRDSRHQVTEVELPLSNVTFTRDPSGNVTRGLYSDGTDLTFTYDKNDRLTAATGLTLAYDTNGRIIESNGLPIQRDGAGRIGRVTFAPGKFVDYTYNPRHRVTKVTDWLGGETAFFYDAVGQLTETVRPNGVNTLYAYDSDGLLLSVQEKHGGTTLASVTLTRNPLGQIQTAARVYPPGTPPLNFSPSEEVAAYNAASQVSGYIYDAMGRCLADADYDYNWDLASRLTSIGDDGQTTAFTYDAAGQLLGRTAGGATRQFTWNYGFGLPSVGVIHEDTIATRYYIRTPDGSLLYSIDATTDAARYYHFDEMGNTTAVTGADGSVEAAYRYTPYGEKVADSSAGALENPFTYQGRWGMMAHGDNGLYYIRARWYDAGNARFLSRDPVKLLDPRIINPYPYAASNPMLFIDPTGRKPTTSDKVTLGGRGDALWDLSESPGFGLQTATFFFPHIADEIIGGLMMPSPWEDVPLPPGLNLEEGSPIVSVLDDLTPGVLLDTGEYITFPTTGRRLQLQGGPSEMDHLPPLDLQLFNPAPPPAPKPPILLGNGPPGFARPLFFPGESIKEWNPSLGHPFATDWPLQSTSPSVQKRFSQEWSWKAGPVSHNDWTEHFLND